MAAYSLPSSKATRVKARQSLSLGPRVRRKGDLSGYHQPCYDESHSLNAAYAQIFRVLYSPQCSKAYFTDRAPRGQRPGHLFL